MNVLGVGAPAPTSLSSSALHFRLKVTNILPPSPIYHSRTVSRESRAVKILKFQKKTVGVKGTPYI